MRETLHDHCYRTDKRYLLDEWDEKKNAPLTPNDVTRGSSRKVWWRCSKGHSWQAAVHARVKGSKCPYCLGRRAEQGRSLAALYPEIAKQWDTEKNAPLTPDAVRPGSHQRVWWKCEKGHSYRTEIRLKTQGCRCPYCANKKIIAEENSLAATKPELAAQWDFARNGDLKPTQVFGGSLKKVWWRCERGHSWYSAIATRACGGYGCPVCSGKAVASGENDLQTAFPKIAAEWNKEKNEGMKPNQVAPYSNRIVWWKCPEGHEWKGIIALRTSRGLSCPYCSGKQLLAGFNDLATRDPNIAAEWHPVKNAPLTPEQVMSKSEDVVWWQCPKGHEWKSAIKSRTVSGCGCPVCANRVVQTGCNDLKTLYPYLAAEWDLQKNAPLTPDKIVSGSRKKVWWLCPLGHSYQMMVLRRTMYGYDCPYCSGSRVLAGFNDLGSRRPEIAAQWHPSLNGPVTPQTVTEHSNRNVWWQCPEGHVWKAKICRRSRGFCNCPVCNGRVNKIRRNRYKLLFESSENAGGLDIGSPAGTEISAE